MKVILNEDVKNLGEEGDVVIVKNGYARNFLLPNGIAVPCTKGNLSIFSQKKDAIEKRKEVKREAAKSLKEKIEAVTLTLKIAAGDTGKLFGSVNNATIAEGLFAQGIEVERKRIEVVGTHVKMVGSYQARVKLYGEEVATLAFIVEGITSETLKRTAVKKEVVAEESEEEVVEETVEAVEEAATEETAEEVEAEADAE